MRVLFISTHFPYDSRNAAHGGFKRMGVFIDAIKQIAQLDMLFYVWPEIDVSQPAVAKLERSLSEHWDTKIHLVLCPRFEPDGERSKWGHYAGTMLSFFREGIFSFTSGPAQVRAFENCLQRKPDAIFAHRLPSMCPPLLTRRALPPIFFDVDDIDHMALLRGISWQRKLRAKAVSYARLPALLWGERRAIRLAHRTFVCSDLDRDYLTNRWRLPGVLTVPNAVALPELQPQTEEPTLLFIGTYGHRPNAEAAEFLIEQIWPLVYREMPTARLVIAGNRPDKIRGYGREIPGVEFTGFVKDLDALYRRSRVICTPIFVGTGTRIKIIEAAAYGKPIVSTRIGAEGLEMRDGCELFLRDDPESFAEACLTLLKDTDLCHRLGSAAHAKMVKCYDRAKIVRLIQGYLKSEPRETDIVRNKQAARNVVD